MSRTTTKPIAKKTKAAPAVKKATEDARRPRQGNQPLCPMHGEPMKAYHSSGMYTYYRCEVSRCPQRDKRVRPVGPLKNLYGHGKSDRDA